MQCANEIILNADVYVKNQMTGALGTCDTECKNVCKIDEYLCIKNGSCENDLLLNQYQNGNKMIILDNKMKHVQKK